jgi:hypothetical protein
MSQFLEMLKARLSDAQQRLQVAQVNLSKAQAEHQAVMQEFGSWQNAVSVESRREQQQPIAAPPPAPPATFSAQPVRRIIGSVTTVPPQHFAPAATPAAPTMEAPSVSGSEINKADLIRDVLRENPNGITPADLWRKVKDHVGRPYVYSVLKRLKDRKKVAERRGKYFLQIEPKQTEEAKESPHVN